MKMKVAVLSLFVLFSLGAPAVSRAASLSSIQVDAVTALLKAFGVDATLIARVEHALGAAAAVLADPVPAHVPTDDPIYPLGALGYDLSFATHAYPVDPFGFAVVGTSGGRAFYDNARMDSEYAWARDFANRAAPTLYMNLNAPYGAKVSGHIMSPRDCTSVVPASGPTSCQGYDFGYNAAAHAYAYALNSRITAAFWWLDIEEANSWSPDTAVNDATIQGAIDYLNSKGVRVGIYSMPYMWNDIAGASFTPRQTIAGKAVSIPNWFPVGTATRTQALNACNSKAGFISGSPVWIIQYEESSTAVDQNIAC